MSTAVHTDSLWNLLRGAAYSVLVSGPPIAAVWLDAGEWYAVWVVGFSLIPWISLSALGIQPALLTIVGKHHGGSDLPGGVGPILVQSVRLLARNVLLGSSLALLVIAAAHVLGLADSSVGALGGTPGVLSVLLVLAVSQLASSTANAYLLAVDRSRLAALLTAVGAAVVASGVVLLQGLGLRVRPVPFTLLIAAGHVPPVAVLLRHVLRAYRAPDSPGQGAFATNVRTQLRDFVRTHAVWVAPGILVAGLDTALVAEFDAPALRPYTVALALAALLNGGLGAITSPYVPRLARIPDPWRVRGPIPVVLAVLASAASALFIGVHTTAFRGFASSHRGAVLLLGVAVLVRLLTVPQSVQAIAAGKQRLLYPSSVGEALVNVAASSVLGYAYGASGVAAGTLLGAWWAVGAHGYARARVVGGKMPDATWAATVLLPALVMTTVGMAHIVLWNGST